jgi:hypothetical protein
MTEAEFWETTPAMFKYRQDGFSEDFRNNWEQTRFISYVDGKDGGFKEESQKAV